MSRAAVRPTCADRAFFLRFRSLLRAGRTLLATFVRSARAKARFRRVRTFFGSPVHLRPPTERRRDIRIGDKKMSLPGPRPKLNELEAADEASAANRRKRTTNRTNYT